MGKFGKIAAAVAAVACGVLDGGGASSVTLSLMLLPSVSNAGDGGDFGTGGGGGGFDGLSASKLIGIVVVFTCCCGGDCSLSCFSSVSVVVTFSDLSTVEAFVG